MKKHTWNIILEVKDFKGKSPFFYSVLLLFFFLILISFLPEKLENSVVHVLFLYILGHSMIKYSVVLFVLVDLLFEVGY